MSITQAEADYLIGLPKRFVTNDPLELGPSALKLKRELVSADGRERFLLDIWCSGARLGKYTFQNRARVIIILVRVDVGDTLEHTNPDGVQVSGSHIHIYREEYDDKFAFPLNTYPFGVPTDMVRTFEDFANFCHIETLPPIARRLI
jgi:hypothetical protein